MDNLTQNTEPTPPTGQQAGTEPTTLPTKKRTPAQAAAARANGSKSRGPATDHGKSVSAQNSRRHGLLSKAAVIPHESATAFQTLSTSLYEAWEPRDEYERGLVDTMVLASWRRMRAVAMESAAIAHQLNPQPGGTETPAPNPDQAPAPGAPDFDGPHKQFLALSSLAARDRALELLARYDARFTRAYDRAGRTLLAYRAQKPVAPEPQPPVQEQPAAPQPPVKMPESPQPDPIQNSPHEPDSAAPTHPAPAPTHPAPAPTRPATTPNLPPSQPETPVSPRRARQIKKWLKKIEAQSRQERRR